MIFYLTKLTLERYKLKLPHEMAPPTNQIVESLMAKERGNELMEWGGKIFYFDRRKCVQLVNFASKFTLFLMDLKVADMNEIGNIVAQYLLELYKEDANMCDSLKRMFSGAPYCTIDRLTNRSIIATLNHTQRSFAWDGYRFYDYIQDNILHTIQINRDVNFDWIFSRKTDAGTEYFSSGELFRELVTTRYGVCPAAAAPIDNIHPFS